jgi:hypothetical protein
MGARMPGHEDADRLELERGRRDANLQLTHILLGCGPRHRRNQPGVRSGSTISDGRVSGLSA